MTVNTEARDKEKRREAFLASQAPMKCESLSDSMGILTINCRIGVRNKGGSFHSVSDNESEHDNEEEEWEAQQIRKGVTGAQVRSKFINTLNGGGLFCFTFCLRRAIPSRQLKRAFKAFSGTQTFA